MYREEDNFTDISVMNNLFTDFTKLKNLEMIIE